MKKGLLLAGAVFSLGVLAGSANAVTIRIDEEQVLKFGARGIIDAIIKDDRGIVDGNKDKSDIVFTHRDARIYFKYKLNKIISYGFQASLFAPGKAGNIEVFDSFINLAFAPEFNIIAGSYKVPFERHSGLQSYWTYLFPTWLGMSAIAGYKHAFTNPVANDHKPFRSGSRSAGLTAWGNIADGMFKYYVGVFDASDEGATSNAKTAYSIRVQFTPTMLGYKAEKGYVLKNTYVGKKDVLTIGLSYTSQSFGGGAKDQDSWGVDLMWEQKFGTIVPDIQIGYVKHTNWAGTDGDDRTGWLVQGQLLYDQKVFLGKPALAARYVQTEFDRPGSDPKLKSFGVAINYYIKGPTNRIALWVENVKLDNVNLTEEEDSYTDVGLSVFYNF